MLIEMLAQCRSFSSRRQYIYTPKQQQQTWKKPCGRFYFPNTAKICSSLLYDLDTTHTGRSSPCTWSFVSTYGRCDDLQLLSQRMWQSFSFSLPPTLPPFPFPFFIPFLSSSLLFFLPSSLSLSLFAYMGLGIQLPSSEGAQEMHKRSSRKHTCGYSS